MPLFTITIEGEDPGDPRARLQIRAETNSVSLVARAIMLTLPDARIFGDRILVPDQFQPVEALPAEPSREEDNPPAPDEPEEEAGPRTTRYERGWVL